MKFYMYIQEKVIGPYDKEEIIGRFGGLSKDTLICRADKYDGGSRKWHSADQVPELADCVKRERTEPLPAVMETDEGDRALSLRILSTDDDPHIRELLWHMLCDAGHAVEFARDGEEVFKRLGEKEYDLLILDVNMPKMNGYKVSELIHKKMPNPPKVMIFTGRELQKERLQFVCSGADAILNKGVDNDKLIRTIEGLFPGDGGRSKTPEPEMMPGLRTFQAPSFLPSPAIESASPGPAVVSSTVLLPAARPAVPAAAPSVHAPLPPEKPVVPEVRPAAAPARGPAAATAALVQAASKTPSQLVDTVRPAAEAVPVLKPSGDKGPEDAPDMNRLMGHIDLECARLEMQFEKYALKLLEANRESAEKLQAEWRRMRVFTVYAMALLLAALSLAVFFR